MSLDSSEIGKRIARRRKELDTTPDEFLVGTLRDDDPDWKAVAEPLRTFDTKKLSGLADYAGLITNRD